MGFEVCLRGTHRSAPVQTINPFTRESVMDEPLVMNADELRAAMAVMTRHGATTNDLGVTQVALAKAHLQFMGFDEQGDVPSVVGDLACACEFLFELATAGRMAIQNVYAEEGEPTSYVTSVEAFERAQTLQGEDDLGPTVLVESAAELVAAFAPHHANATGYASRATSQR
jgi:hypothetical protein